MDNWFYKGFFSKGFNFKQHSISFLLQNVHWNLVIEKKKIPYNMCKLGLKNAFFWEPSSMLISRKFKLNFETRKKNLVKASSFGKRIFLLKNKCKQTADNRVNKTLCWLFRKMHLEVWTVQNLWNAWDRFECRQNIVVVRRQK